MVQLEIPKEKVYETRRFKIHFDILIYNCIKCKFDLTPTHIKDKVLHSVNQVNSLETKLAINVLEREFYLKQFSN